MTTRYYEISISSLEKGVKTLVRKLEAKGFETEIDVFRTGPGGVQYYGPSYVELWITGSCINDDSEAEEFDASVKFIAGGYDTVARGEICGTSGWRDMAQRGMEHLQSDLNSQGWQGVALGHYSSKTTAAAK